MYDSKMGCFNMKFYFCSKHGMAAEVALVDSGATENFLNHDMAKRLGITPRLLAMPRVMNNIDGTTNQQGLIHHYYDFELRMGDHKTIQRFYIGGIGTDRFILGFPWLQEFNPQINWMKKICLGPPLVVSTTNKTLGELRAEQMMEEAAIWGQSLRDSGDLVEGNEIIYAQAAHFAQEWAIQASKQQAETTMNDLPSEYKRHWKVFSEEEAKCFPPSRGEYDHAINLKPGAPDTLQCKIYPLSPPEAKFMRDWTIEQVDKGYIEESKSPYAVSSFCIKKKNGTYRPVQDYRPVNYWTIRDQYPLPNITHITRELQGHTLFTKFDIRLGYNNV
jgi:hypothetical protein